MARHAVIIAGGSGTRLWPMSRSARPKQLLPLFGGRSLLQLAAERLEGIAPPGSRYVCAAERHRAAIRAVLPQFPDDHIIGEPEGRDTVNAVGLAAVTLLKSDPAAVFAVLTADHLIEPQPEVIRAFHLAFRLVEADASRLVTFAIKPTHAATSYGYVEPADAIDGFTGAFRVKRFVEKPGASEAGQIISSGGGWNSGMFVFAASTLLEAIQWHAPQSHAGLMKIAGAWDSPQRAAVLKTVYLSLPRVSIDYAIMEPASKDSRLTVCTIPMNVKWLDVGSWASYAQTLPPPPEQTEAQNNRAPKSTQALHLDSCNIVAVSDDPAHTITTIGCEDLIIVHTKDATLVCKADDAERVKELARRVDQRLQ